MIMKKKFLLASFLFAIVFAFFSSCKKYPENTLWIKSPQSAIIGLWTLEQLTVNGVDSTNYEDVEMYTNLGIIFLDEDLNFNEQYEGGWKFGKKKKDITINAKPNSPALVFAAQKNLFRDGQTWKIEKLTKDQFWLSVTNGSSNYFIKFKH